VHTETFWLIFKKLQRSDAMNCQTITPKELAERMKNGGGLHLVDVRTQGEYAAEHVEGAKCFPLQDLDPEAVLKNCGGANGEIYLICKSGQRARMAAVKFQNAGHDCVVVVDGGTEACVQAGLPVVRGKGVMSLERQVRIAAGALVVLGVALSYLVHPGFVGLSAFVGAGLVFAGVTDTCAMGMLIARMPWNR